MVTSPVRITILTALLFLSLVTKAREPIHMSWLQGDRWLSPGQVHNLVIRTVNNTESAEILHPEVLLPEGIRLAVPLQPLTLGAGQSKIQIISLNVPGSFTAGTHVVTFRHKNSESGSIRAELSMQVTIAETDGITFENLETPSFVIAGDDINLSYLLKNTGNVRRKITFETYQCDVVTPPVADLDPGETMVVRVNASTNKELAATTHYVLSVQAVVSDSLKIRRFNDLKIFPSKDIPYDPYFRFPVKVATRYLTRDRQGEFASGHQFEVSGEGFLDEDNQYRLEFLARGPNNFGLSFMGLYDEYYASLSTDKFQTFLGDKSYSLTPLTESARFGTGFEQSIQTEKGSLFGVFYVEPRFIREIKSETAGYADFAIGKHNRIGVNYLNKTMVATHQDAQLASLTARIVPIDQTTLDLEYSLGRYRSFSDDAYRIALFSQNKYFSFTGNLIHAGTHFPGYYSNSTFYFGNLNFRITRALTLSLSAREDFSNAALDTLLSSSPYSRIRQAALNYQISRQVDIRSYYIKYQRQDRMPVKQFDYDTESFNLWINQNYTKFGIQAGAEYGSTTNNLLSEAAKNSQNSYRFMLNMQYRPAHNFSLQWFSSYSNMNSFIAANQSNFLIGGAAYGQITPNLRANIQLQNTYAIEDYYRNRNLVQFAFDYTFLRNHQITAQTFYTLFQNQTEKPDLSVSVTYAYKLGIPLRKRKDSGSVRGRLTGSDGNPSREAFIYLNNRSSLTDQNGEFLFNHLSPGQYQLMTDRRNFGINEILSNKAPVVVNVASQKEEYVALQMVQAAKVKGHIIPAAPEDHLLLSGQAGPVVGNVMMDLSDESLTTKEF